MVVPLHVIIEVDAEAVIYGLMGNNQWKPKSTNYGQNKKFGDMEYEPMLWGDTQDIPWAIQDPVNGEMGLAQVINVVWSGVQTDPKQRY